MRKYRYLAVAAAGLMVLTAPAAAFASSHSSKPVLTVKGGKAVKKGATLSASLAKGQDVTFAIGALASATCSKSSFTAKVTANPTKRGTATISVTKESLSKCTVHTTEPITLVSITPINLPYTGTITAKGKVTIVGTSKAPAGFTAVVKFAGSPLTCIYVSKSGSKGTAANKHNTVTFSKQAFVLQTAGSSSLCTAAPSSTFSAVFGPVKTSGKTVFVG